MKEISSQNRLIDADSAGFLRPSEIPIIHTAFQAPMTSTSKTITAVLALAIVAGAAWWYWSGSSNPGLSTANVSDQTSQQPAAQPQAQVAPAPSLLSQGNTDEALVKDMATIDSQITGLGSDTASFDQAIKTQ